MSQVVIRALRNFCGCPFRARAVLGNEFLKKSFCMYSEVPGRCVLAMGNLNSAMRSAKRLTMLKLVLLLFISTL